MLSTPKYLSRMLRGKKVARSTFICATTGRRRDILFGPYDSPQSREAYHRAVAAWEANGRVLAARQPKAAGRELTVSELCLAYMHEVNANYTRTHAGTIAGVLRVLRQLHGSAAASGIGPNAVREVRSALVVGGDKRKPWTRNNCNRAVRLIVQMFRWAASHEMLSGSQVESIRCIQPLRRGKTAASDPAPIGCVDASSIEAVRNDVSRQVRAMVDLQLSTGMRPGEVCAVRVGDVHRTGDVWQIRLTGHKNAHRGQARTIYLGPRAKAAILPFLARPSDAFVFCAADSVVDFRSERTARRVTPASCGNGVGDVRATDPKWRPGDGFTREAYTRAIARACTRTGVPRWSPNQLRHNYATEIRRQFGLEAAAILLGHSSALVTDAVYAERDSAKAVAIAAECG